MATRTPRRARSDRARVHLTDDPYYRVPVDPYTDDLFAQAARIRDAVRAEDDELADGWAA